MDHPEAIVDTAAPVATEAAAKAVRPATTMGPPAGVGTAEVAEAAMPAMVPVAATGTNGCVSFFFRGNLPRHGPADLAFDLSSLLRAAVPCRVRRRRPGARCAVPRARSHPRRVTRVANARLRSTTARVRARALATAGGPTLPTRPVSRVGTRRVRTAATRSATARGRGHARPRHRRGGGGGTRRRRRLPLRRTGAATRVPSRAPDRARPDPAVAGKRPLPVPPSDPARAGTATQRWTRPRLVPRAASRTITRAMRYVPSLAPVTASDLH